MKDQITMKYKIVENTTYTVRDENGRFKGAYSSRSEAEQRIAIEKNAATQTKD